MVVDESSAPRQHAVVDSAQLNAITRRCSPSSLIPHPSSLSLLALVVLAWGVFSWALVAQHRSYRSHAYDLGFFDQIIWNTSRGRWFETSFLSWNFLGQHVEPVLLLFAAVYRVWPNVELLLLTEAAVAAWAAVPLYLAARKLLASDAAGLMVGAAYLLSPHLHGAVLFDFHPEVMGTASIFAAFALIVNRRPGWALAAIGTLFLLKEDAALAGVGFAVVIWLRGYRRHALTLVAASMLYLLLVVGVLMTAIRGGAGDLQSRYSWIGRSPTEIISAPIRRPGAVAAHLVGPRQRGAVAYVLGSLAFVPLAGPGALAAAPLLI
ncbi:MAG: DUF2079 domain-containing protein, partial [Chloroflexi bacterium]|nr:DUF2079 domain-containing protein [Chloroflexota bacterium]